MSNIRELSQLAASIVVGDSTRNIGIGTSSPSSKLSVGGDLNVSGVITATSFYGDGSGLTGISSFSGNYNDLTNTPEIPSISGLASEGYVDNLVAISTFSGNYNDLINQPSIPSISGLASEGYVNQQVNNLIDGAPDALNTLNELAAALNDDSSFATSITNSLSTKISGVGIQSAGSVVGSGITTLNFVGSGNTFAVNGNVVDISISGGGSVSISTVAPSDPSEGDLWYSPIYGRTFIYYSDVDSSQWIDTSPFKNNDIDKSLTIATRSQPVILSLFGAGLSIQLRSGIGTASF